jgi:UDP-N-acetylglucosamine 2-epimerase (non-hydrolysing)
MALLAEHVNHVLVHTGQNYDYELNAVFFEEMGVQKPDYFLGVDTSSLGSTVGGILTETEKVLKTEQPDAVLILGDTNSAISAYIARRMKIPIYHMEAGNRCFDLNVPEETNRRMVDHLSDFNLVYTEHGRNNLLAEGLHQRRIYKTGSPMREVLNHYLPQINASSILDALNLEPQGFFVVSLHREENVDNPEVLASLTDALIQLGEIYQKPIIISTHPRTRKRVDDLQASKSSHLQWLKPFGFYDYNKLQMMSWCTISDSGTIAEESSILDFPAITPRYSIERPEAQDTGAIMACGTSVQSICNSVELVVASHRIGTGESGVPDDYKIDNTSERVVKLILSTAALSNMWDGIRGKKLV